MADGAVTVGFLVLYSIHEFQQAAKESVHSATQTVMTVFQDNALPHGTFTWGGRAIDPGAITDIGLLTVESELVDILGVGQTRVAHDLCRKLPNAMKRHHHQEATGHFGIYHGQRWCNEILPRVPEAVLATA